MLWLKMCAGGVFVQRFLVFGAEHPRLYAAAGGKLGRNIPGCGGQQLFQTGRLVRRRQKAKHRQTPAVGKKIAAQLTQIRARRDAAQAAAIIESAVVQRPHALGQRDLLHKISAKRVQRRAVCALRAPERAAFRLPPGGKTVWPDLGHRPPGHRGGHGGAGGIPKHPQHAGPRCGRGPQYADARLQNFFARLSQQLFTTPPL